MKQIEEHVSPNVVKFLVGNKSDAERKVDKSEGVYLAAQYNILFAEVSAKEDTGIEQLFYDFGLEIKKEILDNKEEEKQPTTNLPNNIIIKPN